MTTPAAPRRALAIPGLRAIRTYDRSWLPVDALAGLTVWALLVPQALAYAQLGGFDAVVGLYASLGALLGYALMGGVREMSVGPEATIALLDRVDHRAARGGGPEPVPGARRRGRAHGGHPADARGDRAPRLRDPLPVAAAAGGLRGGLRDRDDREPARQPHRHHARGPGRHARRAGARRSAASARPTRPRWRWASASSPSCSWSSASTGACRRTSWASSPRSP